jgi:4-hydroxy-tetrahydrodipicolinate reductase
MGKLVIGLFGFGRTGSSVAQEIISDEGFELRWVIRKSVKDEGKFASRLLGFHHDEGKIFSIEHIDFEKFFEENMVDIIIDFSDSSSVNEYKKAPQYGIRIVSAISNYNEKDFDQLVEISRETAVLYSPNITVGINILIEATKLFKKILPNADIDIIEEHFKEKKSISGTAIRIAEDLELDKEKHIKSIRAGGIVGTHEVIFGLPNQTLRIKHESLDRAAFGQGALYAAKWIMGKTQSLYSMEEAVSGYMA